MRFKFIPARLFAWGALIALITAAPTTARAAEESTPPVADKDKGAGADAIERFVAAAIPDANFLGQSSRLAIGLSTDAKIRDFAQRMANAQTTAANSLAAWVNAIGPIVTDRSTYPGRVEEPPGARISAPQMLHSQAEVLQRLSTLRGRDFDALYIEAQKDTLQHLTNIYQGYIENDGEPGLRAIAVRELAGAKDSLSMLAALSANEAGTRHRAP